MSAGIKLMTKGDLAKPDIPAAAASRDLIITDGIGHDSFAALAAAKATVGVYCKASGVRPGDAQWSAAQPLLWPGAVHVDRKWMYGRVQTDAVAWAKAVTIPYVRAAIDQAPSGLVTEIFVDNTTWQDPSLFAGGPPHDWDGMAYQAGTVAVVGALVAAFPGLGVIVNGWCGGAPAGNRGEVWAGWNLTRLRVYFENFYFKQNGTVSGHFLADQAGAITLLNSGKGVVIEEPGVPLYSAKWRQAFGIAISTSGVSLHPEAMMFNMSGAPWVDWWR